MMRVGVTGIFASGKGTVCAFFQDLGAWVIDTDETARRIVRPGEAGYQRIIQEFGTGFLNQDSTLNRRELAALVFGNREKVLRLNGITHPLILNIVLEESTRPGISVVNTPLLFESGFNLHMDKNIVVTADVEQAIERGSQRDSLSREEIEARLRHQIPLNEKIKLADYVIDNSGSLEQTKRQVYALWKIFQEISKR